MKAQLFFIISFLLYPANLTFASDSKVLNEILNTHFPSSINIIKTPRGMVASFPQDLIFLPNSIELSCNGKNILTKIGYILSNIDNESTIEGHSESFGKLEAFEASMIKADIVRDYITKCYPKLSEKLFSVGLGNFDPQNKVLSEGNPIIERIDIVFFAYDTKR